MIFPPKRVNGNNQICLRLLVVFEWDRYSLKLSYPKATFQRPTTLKKFMLICSIPLQELINYWSAQGKTRLKQEKKLRLKKIIKNVGAVSQAHCKTENKMVVVCLFIFCQRLLLTICAHAKSFFCAHSLCRKSAIGCSAQ